MVGVWDRSREIDEQARCLLVEIGGLEAWLPPELADLLYGCCFGHSFDQSFGLRYVIYWLAGFNHRTIHACGSAVSQASGVGQQTDSQRSHRRLAEIETTALCFITSAVDCQSHLPDGASQRPRWRIVREIIPPLFPRSAPTLAWIRLGETYIDSDS